MNGTDARAERTERRYAEESGSEEDLTAPATIRSRIDDLSNYTGYQSEIIDKLTTMLEDILSPAQPEIAVPDSIKESEVRTSDVEQRLSIIATRVDRNTNRLNILMKRINL